MWQIILPSSLLKFTITVFILKRVLPILINYYKWWTHPLWSDPKIGGPEKNRFSSSFLMGRFVTLAKGNVERCVYCNFCFVLEI